MIRKRKIQLHKHVNIEVTPYNKLAPDIWLTVKERLPNGKYTNKNIAYAVDPNKLSEIISLLANARAEIERNS